MEQDKKEKMIGVLGTSAFHLVLVLLLLFVYLEAPDGKSIVEWSGVPVMFGNVPDAFGSDEPYGGGGTIENQFIAPNQVDVSLPDESSSAKAIDDGTEAAVATQDLEESVAIDRAVNEAREAAQQEQQQLLAEQNRQEQKRLAAEAQIAQQKAAEEAKRKEISDQMSGLFGQGTGSGSRGETEGTGTQGVPTGNASFGKTTGIGGWGSYDLGGRSLGSGGLIKPNYSVDDYGTVVVDIIVNPQGRVLEASIGRGTNTPSDVLKREAVNAAKKTRFNEVEKTGNQKGKITYKFNLN